MRYSKILRSSMMGFAVADENVKWPLPLGEPDAHICAKPVRLPATNRWPI